MTGAKIKLSEYYYKIRIVLTFSTVAALIVIFMSWSGYAFVKELLLNQVSDKVKSITGLIAERFSKTQIELLEIGPPSSSARDYFVLPFQRYIKSEPKAALFVFERDFKVILHSDPSFPIGLEETKLKLNEKEIFSAAPGISGVSLPFKGEDGKWYLWGFHRLSPNLWLALKASAARLEDVDNLARDFFFIGLAGVILALVLGLIIANSISKPVDRLVKFSFEIGRGNFKAGFPEGVRGEFETLARAMDKMKNDLAENQQEREKMLAQIAHEIRNPLGGIELLTGLLKEDLSKNGLDTGYANKISGEIHGLKKLINAFLEFGKPMPANPQMCNLVEIVEDTLRGLSDQLNDKQVEIVKEIKLEKVFFDYGHLKQVLFNLLANGLDLSNNGGIIKIKSFAEKEKWVISVSDNGPGIPDEIMQTIFEPFFTTKKNGTGLGLAVCKKLCIENKASITAQNNIGGGSTFIITGDVTNAG